METVRRGRLRIRFLLVRPSLMRVIRAILSPILSSIFRLVLVIFLALFIFNRMKTMVLISLAFKLLKRFYFFHRGLGWVGGNLESLVYFNLESLESTNVV